ncbi:tripartite tricarboxylate transporter TctB family protein [Nocardiopsis lambiniae]|uniref:Tripartite tricarboxylate transporter TctB family protein n=1 Tax=Nocardiopsis lambiniae TaxID=3075539 RepID=A0ABU2M8X4_9ACTN|nr:tripartite tricarboxylate transporter TctB family protein [Nocardiopsis sp. DSM 44743]MDT0328416.1 tripartite tricarboxylate transporter TctB family protein [Nocardiopsis sp. DSM 44743]
MSEKSTERGSAPAVGAASGRPRKPWGPRVPVLPERAFLFSPRTLGVAIALFAIGYLVLAFQMPDYTAVNVPVQPSTLPRWLGVVLLVLAVLLFFQRPQVDGGPEAAPTEGAAEGAAGASADAETVDTSTEVSADTSKGEARLGRFEDTRLEIGLFVAALVAYVALFEFLGFILATALYLGSMTWYLGYRRHLVNAVVAIALPFTLYAGMTWGLNVALPNGLLPF